MKTREIQAIYHKAIKLLHRKRYEEALSLLQKVDQERPDIKNVLYPMAICCEKLGRIEEGIGICEQILLFYDHEKTRAIKNRLLFS